MINNFYSSSNDSVNNIGYEVHARNPKFNQRNLQKIYFTSKTDPETTDSDKEAMNKNSNNDDENNKNNKYLEYENRPIKPLDANAFYKQISEYSEMSSEEIEQMKKRIDTIRSRSKTAESKPVNRLPQQKNFSKNPISRQLSLNHPTQLQKPSPQQPPSTAVVNNNKLRKRSKTQDDLDSHKTSLKTVSNHLNLNINNQIKSTKASKSTTNTPLKVKQVKTAGERNSPRTPKIASHQQQHSQNSPRKVQLNRKSSFTITPSKINKKNNEPKEVIPKQATKISNDDVESPTEEKENSNLSKILIEKQGDLSLISMEIHSKLQKQRQEMRLQREKNLRELKNQIKILDHQKELNEFESFYNKVVEIPKNLTFEDRCATKIQAAFRGYLLRKSKFVRPKLILLKYKKLQRNVKYLKSNFSQLKKDQLDLIKFNQDTTSNLIALIQSLNFSNSNSQAQSNSVDFQTKINPLKMSNNLFKIEDFNLDNNLKIENEELKLKLKLMEEKCNNLERKLNENEKQITQEEQKLETNKQGFSQTVPGANSSPIIKSKFKYKQANKESIDSLNLTEPKLDIYPPLRVRLQKLNEKSVALKWNHNPKNILIELSGYNIYINDEMCGQMKPTDTVASINGIQEEGEYKIYIRSFCSKILSDKSNVVVTRVKRKQSSNVTNSSVSNSISNSNKKANDDVTTSLSNSDSEENNTQSQLKTSNNCSGNFSGLSDRNESIERKLSSDEISTKNTHSDIASKLFKYSKRIGHLKSESSTDSEQSGIMNNIKKPFQMIESSSSFTVNTEKSSLQTKEQKPVSSKPPISPTEGTLTRSRNNSKERFSSKENLNADKEKEKEKKKLNLINDNAKYSPNEPNLLAKTQLSSTTSSSGSNIPRTSLLRQSISFDDDENDENDDVEHVRNESINEFKSLKFD